jgi:hypothetical protein
MKIARITIRRHPIRLIALRPPTLPREPNTTENLVAKLDAVILECGGLPPLCEVQTPLQSQQSKLASPKAL